MSLKLPSLLGHFLTGRRLPHALLFIGTHEAEKREVALAFVQALFSQEDPQNAEQHCQKIASGNHPDLHIYQPEGKIGMHSLAQMHALLEEVALHPHEAPYKVFLIHDAERMLPASSNALLKTLEEPPVRTLFILLTAQVHPIPPTLRSRCQTLFMQSAAAKRSELQTEVISFLLSGKRTHYLSLQEWLEKMQGQIEAAKREREKELRAALQSPSYAASYGESSLLQKELVEQEINGAITLYMLNLAETLFVAMLEWCRDLVALEAKMPHSLLLHGDLILSSRSKAPPFNKLQREIMETRLALERGQKLTHALERLLLSF